jgi:hypothetical protein
MCPHIRLSHQMAWYRLHKSATFLQTLFQLVPVQCLLERVPNVVILGSWWKRCTGSECFEVRGAIVPSIYLPTYLHIYLSTYLPTYVVPIYLSLSIYLSIHLSIYPYLSIYLSLNLPLNLSERFERKQLCEASFKSGSWQVQNAAIMCDFLLKSKVS